MVFNRSLWSSNRMDWGTPQDLFDQLNEEFGPIPLDVCAWDWNAKCPAWLTPFDDALSLSWGWILRNLLPDENRVCWMNPPYGRAIKYWVEKARFEATYQYITTIALLPSRTDTAWWHEHIWSLEHGNPHFWVREVRFLRGRLRFEGATNSAPFGSQVVVFGP